MKISYSKFENIVENNVIKNKGRIKVKRRDEYTKNKKFPDY